MTPEAQRIAIAEACGLKPPFLLVSDYIENEHSAGFQDRLVDAGDNYVPDYLTDLNAMHEAEKVLGLRAASGYNITLIDIARFTEGATIGKWSWHATAAQRAEAFLRTIGKWEDGK